MKDIIRIHIAKVPYSIELAAKKELEKYMTALEVYTADDELLLDIEIRMTELLLERGVKQEAIISSSDVAAIRAQLGEPRDFMTDEVALGSDTELLSKDGLRRLYRNLDDAALGGVLSGIASYLRVSVLWVRLAFIILAFVSFGVFVLLYILAWLIMPPARTAAEKLQMAGRPVSLQSIRELNESGMTGGGKRRSAVIRRIITIFVGITAVFGAIVSTSSLVAVFFEVLRNDNTVNLSTYKVPLIFMFVAGVLLTVLFMLAAFAAFAQKFNKRIWVSGIIIITLGLTAFGMGLILGIAQQRATYDEIQRNTIEVIEKLPATFSSVTALSVDISDATKFVYIVDTHAPTIKQRMQKGATKVKISIENGSAKVSLEPSINRPYGAEAIVTMYGPMLESIIVNNGNVSYNAGVQAKLKIEAHNASSIGLEGSRINILDATLDGSAQFLGDTTSISSAELFLSGHPSVSLGNIKTLKIKSPEACAANAPARLDVQNIFSATYEYNGVETAIRSTKRPCLETTIATDENRSYEYKN